MQCWRQKKSSRPDMKRARPLPAVKIETRDDQPRAYIIIRLTFADGRHKAIASGLAKAGWKVITGTPPTEERQRPDDLIVVWSRNRRWDPLCRAFEMAGGRALVCEEGQIKAGRRGDKVFTLCLDDHNGAGDWPVGGPERWAAFGIDLSPWAEIGTRVVVREQRGIGSKRMASPPDWHLKVAKHLHAVGYEAEIRRHPKIMKRLGAKQVPLEKQIASARALVTWGSSDAVGAVIAGCPTVVCAPATFLSGCVGRHLDDLKDPPFGDRLPALERLAWCQWTLDEIRSGEPFRRFMEFMS